LELPLKNFKVNPKLMKGRPFLGQGFPRVLNNKGKVGEVPLNLKQLLKPAIIIETQVFKFGGKNS